MGVDRRGFIKLAGLSALGAAAKPALDALGSDTSAKGADDGTKRWAMLIDLKKCLRREGCRDCVDACHRVHNVPDIRDPNHEVKWIWKEKYRNAFPTQHHEHDEESLRQQDVLVLCNHCDNPPCVRVCPTKATFRRGSDGLVMMDMHRCIGCRFCMAACPYGSRSFNWRDPRGHDENGRPLIEKPNRAYPTRMRGVVEKCTFCPERLAKNQSPACVEACAQKAIIFGDLNDKDSEARTILRTRHTIRRLPALGTRPQVYYIV